jgi:hypothetical protein
MKSALCLGILFFIALIGLGFLMRHVAQEKWPHAAAINFGTKPTYAPNTVRVLLTDHRADARNYIFPGLFPLDLVYIFCLGGTIALLSLGFANPATSDRLWLLLIVPVGYMVADLTENLALARMLSGAPGEVTAGMVTLVQGLTIIKLGLWLAGTAQVIYLFVCWLVRG